MEQRTPSKPPKPSFAAWTPTAAKATERNVLVRSSFQGLSPEEAAARCIDFNRQRNESLRAVTLYHKRTVIARMLQAFAQRGTDLSNLTEEDCTAYRAYLRDLADRGLLSEDSCSGMVRAWNSVMRTVFGETGKPGQGLLMKNFKQHVRRVERLTQEDMERLITAVDLLRFQSLHNREAFRTYLEAAWSTGGRVGSILRLRAGDVNWDLQLVVFRHMKNLDRHEAVLTPRAVVALKAWCDRLRTTSLWQGEETPLFVNPRGRPLTGQWVNKTLKVAAATAGIPKKVSTHVLRKSVGTLIGRENPKLAQLQLGISAEVFNAHYNQPLLEDRLAKRDILPGATWKPTTPAENAGAALLDFLRGRLSREDFEARVAQARQLTADGGKVSDPDPGYL